VPRDEHESTHREVVFMPPSLLRALGLGRLAGPLGRCVEKDAAWIGLLLASLLFVEALGARWAPAYSYDRWDNFEYYTPMIAAAHGALLSGELPVWNTHQHLGESFLANPQMGTFYPPYTLAYAAVDALRLHWKWLCNSIAIAHVLFGAAGGFLLLRHFGVRRSLAFLGALGLASAGYLRTVSAFWIFLAPNFGWLPWMLLCAAQLLEGSRRLRHGLGLALGLVAQAYVGHPQMLVYLWLTLGLFCLGYALVVDAAWRERCARLGWLALHALGAAMLSAVTMLPIFVHTQNTVRKAPMTFDDFVAVSVSREALLGLLLPFYEAKNGFLVREACSLMLHQAGWVVPALGLGLGLWVRSERLRSEQRRLGRTAAVFAVVGVLMLLFSLGDNTAVYGLTYRIPVWSSFRFPHKFLLVALPCLGVAAAIGLELLARDTALRTRARVAAAVAFVALALWGFGFGWAEVLARPWARVGLVSAVVSLGLAPLVRLRLARAVMMAAGVASAACMVALGQTFAPYLIDEPHIPDPSVVPRLGPNRVLPVHLDGKRFDVVPRLLYQSATMLGMDSVTGCTTSMAPDWYLSWLPSSTKGLMPEKAYKELLPSHFLRALNVEFVTAPRGRTPIQGWLKKAGFELMRKLDTVDIYRTGDTLPRAYFASSVAPYTTEGFRNGLIDNHADARAAYVENPRASAAGAANTALPAAGANARVLSADFSRGARVAIDVDAPSGGFLVISISYDPSFNATVDGAPATLYRANAMLQGVAVPPGRHQIVLRYENAAFARSLWLAAAGLGLLVGVAYWRRRGARASAVPAVTEAMKSSYGAT
jgi:membrane protein YfhO